MPQSRKISKRTSGKQAKTATKSTASTKPTAGAKPTASTKARTKAGAAAAPKITRTKAGKTKPAQPKATQTKGQRAATSAAADARTERHPTVAMARGLAEIVEAHGLSELIVDTPEVTLTLRRASLAPAVPTAQPMVVAAPPVMAQPSAPEPRAAAAAPAPAPEPAKEEETHHIVTSPFVGTFYRRPNPDASSYTEVGKRIQKGDVLCIIEAMKLMNEIESDVSGTVVAILIEDAEPVEYGQPLFKVSPN